MTVPVPYTPPPVTTVAPVQFMDLTHVDEEILWALGRASRLGQLAHVDDHVRNPDGTITVRLAYTGDPVRLRAELDALSSPQRSTGRQALPAATPNGKTRWGTVDYVMTGLRVLQIGVAGGIVWLLYVGAMALAPVLAYAVVVLAVVAGIALLAALRGRSGACPGFHCLGCKG